LGFRTKCDLVDHSIQNYNPFGPDFTGMGESMLKNRMLFLIAGALVLCATPAIASVITFDDAYAVVNDGGDVSTFYQLSLGVTISGDNAGVWGGVGNGDPGNWSLLGTNGSAFLGSNDGNSSSPPFNFSANISNISLDIGDSEDAGTYIVTGFLNGTQVASQTFTIGDPNVDTGTWQTASLTGSMNMVEVSTTGPSFAFGIDNVVFSSSVAAPEPSTFVLLAGSFVFAGGMRRWRNSKKA